MISILIPIYNGIEFLKESLNSIKNQSFSNWEVIIGINGHHVNSKVFNIAKNYETEKIKVYDLINVKGKSKALNEMLKYCNYDWISLLDVDDKWYPNKLEEQIKYINEYDVIGTKCQYFGDKHLIPFIPVGNINNYNFLNSNPIINSSCLIKKNICFWDTKFDSVEDYDLWLRLWKRKKKFYNVDKVLVLHRIHKKSAFNTSNKQEYLLQELINKNI